MEPEFKPAAHSDIETLIAFMRELYLHDNTFFDEANTRKALDKILTDDSVGRVFVIEIGDEMVGYTVLTFGYSLEFHGRDAFIDELYISEPYRRQGIGKKTISHLESICGSLGIDALHLEVERENTNAQAVYRNIGFKDHNRYLMTKWITKA
ncbi:MAG TPA: GNAT family N-acetyltransferase [Blastocatellia bacterium]|nr:GNAT family N-acetyltransferase [Blastocatellia bacterium]